MSSASASEVVLVAASLVGIAGDALYMLPHARRDLDVARSKGTAAQKQVARSNHRIAIIRIVLFGLVGIIGVIGLLLPPRSDEGAFLASLGWIVVALAGILLCAMAVFSWRDRIALLDALRSDGVDDEPLNERVGPGPGV